MSNFVRISIFLLFSLLFFSTSFCFPISVLAANQGDSYEPDDSYAESQDFKDIGNGNSIQQSHTFHKFFDEDWIRFDAKKDYTYDITAAARDSNINCDPIIELYASDGTSLLKRINNTGPGGVEFLQWVGSEDAPFFIRFVNDSIHYDSSVIYDIDFFVQKLLSLPGYLKGKVTSNNVPIEGAIIEASNGVGVSLFNGDYVIGLNVESGTVNVSVHKDGYETKSFSIFNFIEGGSETRDVELVRISDPNQPPVITGIPKNEIFVNGLYSFRPIATDPENDNLLFSIVNKPSWLIFNPETGMILGVPNTIHVGKHGPITITVQDSQGASSHLSPFMIEVLDVISLPGILMLLMK